MRCGGGLRFELSSFEFGEKGGELFARMLLAESGDSGAREQVAAFVLGVAGVPFEPIPGDGVPGGEAVQFYPEIFVFDGRFGGGAPAVALPEGNAFGDAGPDVFGIGEELNGAAFAEGAESFDGAGEFHAVVGGGGSAAADFFALASVFKDGGPSARAGVSLAGAVRMDGHAFHRRNVSRLLAGRHEKQYARITFVLSRAGDVVPQIRCVVSQS